MSKIDNFEQAANMFGKMAGAAIMSKLKDIKIDAKWNSDGEWAKDWGSPQYSGEHFERITVAGPDNVEFITSDLMSVTVEGDDEAAKSVRFKVVDGSLRIGRDKGEWPFGQDRSASHGAVTIKVRAPVLAGLKIAGSGSANIDKLRGDAVELKIAGSGDIAVEKVKTNALTVKIAGSGGMRLAGKAKKANFSIAGSGNVHGEELNVKSAVINIAGSGNIHIKSDGEVTAKLVGSGDVVIDGKATCTSKSFGSGKVRCG